DLEPISSGSRDVARGPRRPRGPTPTRSPSRDEPPIFAPPLADASADTLRDHESTDSPSPGALSPRPIAAPVSSAPAAGPKSGEAAVDADARNMSERADVSPAPPPGSQKPYRDADGPLQRALQQVA